MLTSKEKFLKLAEQLDSLAELSIKIEDSISKMKKTATENTAKLDPAHLLNFAKFYLGNR